MNILFFEMAPWCLHLQLELPGDKVVYCRVTFAFLRTACLVTRSRWGCKTVLDTLGKESTGIMVW